MIVQYFIYEAPRPSGRGRRPAAAPTGPAASSEDRQAPPGATIRFDFASCCSVCMFLLFVLLMCFLLAPPGGKSGELWQPQTLEKSLAIPMASC